MCPGLRRSRSHFLLPSSGSPHKFCKEMKANPPTLPAEGSLDQQVPSHLLGRSLAGLGVALYTGPIWGLLGMIFGLIEAFDSVSNGSESADMSRHVSFALNTTAVGMAVGLSGAVMILISVLFFDYRSRWFYSWSIGLSIFWCFAVFPMGLIIGIPISILFTSRRREFEEERGRIG